MELNKINFLKLLQSEKANLQANYIKYGERYCEAYLTDILLCIETNSDTKATELGEPCYPKDNAIDRILEYSKQDILEAIERVGI